MASSVKRTVIGLWDSSEVEIKDTSSSELHQNLEMVLNHYGLKVEYVDIANGIPNSLKDKSELRKYRGVVSWFLDDYMDRPVDYLEFLKKVRSADLPFLIIGELGFLVKSRKDNSEFDPKFINKYMNLFDFEFKGDFFDNPMVLEATFTKEPSLVQFERKLKNEIKAVRVVERLGEGESWLKINVLGSKQSSDVVFINPRLSYVQSGYGIFTNPIDYKKQWRVNPFELVKRTFFKESMDLVPDITTLYGNRTFFTHIDGDGYINISQTDHKSYSGEVIAKDIIKHYKLPIMVSVIVSEVSPELLGNKSIEKKVRSIYRLPYVEGGSHTYTHPMSWELEPSLEEKLSYLSDEEAKKHRGPIVGYPIKDYVMNYEKEVIGSIEYINKKLMPKNKKVRTLLWSGSCAPPREPLKLLKVHGLLNMNGGDGKFDGAQASYTGLSPLYRNVDGYIQVYSSNANENLYTNLWEGPYSGFRDVIHAFENTERPIRVRPINIYYHFYSGERLSSMKSLRETYDYALSQKINPIFPSQYIEMVHGWIDSKIEVVSKKHFKLSGYGKLRTFRLDNTKAIPDYLKSKNIVGHKNLNNSLYIYLGMQENSELFLTDASAKRPYISESSVIINSFKEGKVTGESTYPGYFVIENQGQAKRYEIEKVGSFTIEVEVGEK